MNSQAKLDMLAKIKNKNGFIAALDQSGGSTPKALAAYGIDSSEYHDDAKMFAKVHEMRTRIITSPFFDGDRTLGAILFENTLDREIEGQATAKYLWNVKNVVPFLKVDQGLQPEENGVQLMKPIANLDALLAKANAQNVFGTKMRSLVKQADAFGIESIVLQQFEVGKQIIAAGLVPILEPELDINCPNKAKAEVMLRESILQYLDALEPKQKVMLKLTLPEQANFYVSLVKHPRVLKVVSLSGGYSQAEANFRLAQNKGVIASYSRALSEGLSAKQADLDFNSRLDVSIQNIFTASTC